MLPKWTIPKQRTQCIVQIVPSIPERLLVLHTVAITFLCPSGGKPDTYMHVQALVRWMRHRTAIIPTSYWKGPRRAGLLIVLLLVCELVTCFDRCWCLPRLCGTAVTLLLVCELVICFDRCWCLPCLCGTTVALLLVCELVICFDHCWYLPYLCGTAVALLLVCELVICFDRS